MSEKKWKIERKHRRGCRAVAAVERGDWDTPWAVLDKRAGLHSAEVFGTKSGNVKPGVRGQRTLWLRFCCNDPRCGGRLLVNEERMLAEFVEPAA